MPSHAITLTNSANWVTTWTPSAISQLSDSVAVCHSQNANHSRTPR